MEGKEARMKTLILIADDDALHRTLLNDVLQASGYETLTAENGRRAVELACSVRPGLILMDVQMPALSGCAAATLLKTSRATRPIPIIALTALAMEGDRERLLAAGFDDYLAKPASLKALRAIVARHLVHGTETTARP